MMSPKIRRFHYAMACGLASAFALVMAPVKSAGADGKIVVYIAGSPADIPTALASHYQSIGERWKRLHDAGAIGYMGILNPASMDIP